MKEFTRTEREGMLEENEPRLSIRRQCELLGVNRSGYYYNPRPRLRESAEYREVIMARLDYWNTEEPAWGIKTLVPLLRDEGYKVSHEFLRELRWEMGYEKGLRHTHLI
jgi:putative transposase